MPQPRISIQRPPPGRLSSSHHTSTSAEGSVKGKKLGRKRIFASRSNSAPTNWRSVSLRSAKVTPSSTTSPSIWWKRQKLLYEMASLR